MIYYVANTAAGYLGLIGRQDGRISGLVLPYAERAELTSQIESMLASLEHSEVDADFSGVAGALEAYFAGDHVSFGCELDYGDAGVFDIDVWRAAREVGWGEVTTYGAIADRIGRPHAARAVGQALGRNPIPLIVPCHRVLRSDGRLGGFSAGIHWKIQMLGIEGIHDYRSE